MNKEWVLSQDHFNMLLDWLHPNREQAGQKYEEIRRRLIKIFACRGCYEPEDLADETINRVTHKLPEIRSGYEGEPARYFYGVANKVHLEYIRKKPVQPTFVAKPSSEELEKEYQCLDRCMEELPQSDRELVLQYYREERQAKIEHRKRMAEQLGIAVNALRIRAYRIRTSLHQCVTNCIREAEA
jgi:DNA-directed RNA polymerase specialized sigma24 family protein